MSLRLQRIAIACAVVLSLAMHLPASTSAEPIGNQYFDRTWARTDKPVADRVLTRTWMWGPEAFSAQITEEYAQGPNGQRTVQYFDKSRMEITHDQSVPTDSPWYVGNGLLANELMTGQMQVGDTQFQPREAARVNVAGDPDDTSGVTYWFMGLLKNQPATPVGNVINTILTPGAASNLYLYSDQMAAYGVTGAHYVPETRHTVAQPFWEFMNSAGTVYESGSFVHDSLFENPFYATGLPLTDAYWARVKLAGSMTDVLVQCFERRCLTYTPSNDPAWRVEAGNVGQHYYRWRYDNTPPPPVDPPTYDRIPGLSKSAAIRHFHAIGTCGEPRNPSLGWIFMDCTSNQYPGASYSIMMWATSENEVNSINITVSDDSANPSSRIDAIGAAVLGWAARIPYAGAEPDNAAAIVEEYIWDWGYFGIAGVWFDLNPPGLMTPSWAPSGFWGDTRILTITPDEPGT